VSGDLTFSVGTTIDVLPWDNFVPGVGQEFTILTWGGAKSGDAAVTYDSWFADQGVEFIEVWNSSSLVLHAVPEPTGLVLLCGLVPALLPVRRRRP
jgi:hypothetical protein